jgi:transcriptional regulator with XRE-family HTH domain
MNAISSHADQEQVPAEEWERPEMRQALSVRDIARVYRMLQRIGFSQQRIAAMTGQSQPEVSAVLGGRKIMAYDLFGRIADGLGVPRQYMGLSYEPTPPAGAVARCPRCAADEQAAASGEGLVQRRASA